jgi:Ca-activated chloride channel homolog
MLRWIESAALCLLAPAFLAAQALSPQTGNSAGSPPQRNSGGYRIGVDVNLVVLHASVLDKKGRMVNGLQRNDFRVFEDGQPQNLSIFSHADIPVTMGIVIDDSGSMRPKRSAVNAAAISFVKTSNPQDQAFVVNFNDAYYLDTPGNFAANMEELKSALDKINSSGGTALYDAVYASLDHMKLGNRDKKVLLVITDGEDNSSRYTLAELLSRAQKSDAVIYTIGLLGDDETGSLFRIHGSESKRAAKALEALAKTTGGEAYFPKSLSEVESTCEEIAHSIRNQYTLAYYPTNFRRDGTFRSVRVDAVEPNKHDKLVVRTRTGYFAPKPNPTSAANTSGQE